MKQFFMILGLLTSYSAFATVWNIEVGGESGSKTNPPYYAPQNLTILEGDQVVWNWVGGPFNVTCTGGAQFFASGNLLPGQSYSFTFTVSGIYTFECTLEDHNQTMFGSIFVFPTGTNSIEETLPEVIVSPNPSADKIHIQSNYTLVSSQVFDEMGRMVLESSNLQSSTIDISHLPAGKYILLLRTSNGIARKRIIKQ